ncbi:sugar phosphate isomerase/epimerase family protein [Paenarthrobacter sp. NPDC057981]|uniref:sugar phosphate isomerase/epimerase family protein n=1 Tax=Paenarthrobacter sp. NPDC057981 TaxID=3346297 RepID=UPI0036DD0BE1
MNATTIIENRDLLASCWTWAGNAAPLRGDETSPIDVRTRIEAAAKAGWTGVGFIHADLPEIEATIGLKGLRQLLDDNGIKNIELEFLADWWKTGPERAESDRWRAILLNAAEILGVKTLKIGAELALEGEPAAVDETAFHEEFDRLATQAGEVGTRVALEPMPMNNLKTIEIGAKFIQEVNNQFGGLTVDTWHTSRGGTSYDDLARILPMDKVFIVEIDDAHRDVRGSLWEDTINERLYPGEGDLDTAKFVKAMYEAGWRGHWGVEILSESHRLLPLDQALARAHDTAAATLEAASQLIEV